MTYPETRSAFDLVQEQAEDEGLWFIAETAAEAYLQQELRRLHAAVEHDGPRLAQAVRLLRDGFQAVLYAYNDSANAVSAFIDGCRPSGGVGTVLALLDERDALKEALRDAESVLEYITSPTMGRASGDAAEFAMTGATEHNARLALKTCIDMARMYQERARARSALGIVSADHQEGG